MAAANGTVARPGDIETVLTFIADKTTDGQKPYQKIIPGNGERPTNIEFVHKSITVLDIRGHEDVADLDVMGFQAVNAPSSFTNFDSEEAIKTLYYDECAALIKRVTGAKQLFFFDHTIRKQGAAISDTTRQSPILRAHVDQTPSSARKRIFRHMGDDAEQLSQGRYQILNVWRPIENTVYNWPLAVADYRTMDAGHDLVATRRIVSPTEEGETYHVAYSERQRWYYLSEMTPSECLLLKCCDSKNDVAKVAAHTAFDNHAKDAQPGRQSIEVRALVFY